MSPRFLHPRRARRARRLAALGFAVAAGLHAPRGLAAGAGDAAGSVDASAVTRSDPSRATSSLSLASTAPLAATLEGSWSLALHGLTPLVGRTWDAPYPWGTIGQLSTRVLHGTSWTAMLGLEGLALLAVTDGHLEVLGGASFRTDWILSYDLPACPHPGAFGGCGVGVGGFTFFAIRLPRSRWWLEAGGGWVQQRVRNDELLTLAESVWALSPITALHEDTFGGSPLALRTRVGPGLFFGAHMAHVHPTLRGRRAGVDPPWTEMYPLDAGLGAGARAEARVLVADHVALTVDATFAPLFAGGPTTRREPWIRPLGAGEEPRDGVSTWRRATVSLGWVDGRAWPVETAIAWTALELSDRPVTRLGHHAVLLRFDIPLDVTRRGGEPRQPRVGAGD